MTIGSLKALPKHVDKIARQAASLVDLLVDLELGAQR